MTPLRQRFIEDLQLRNRSPKTIEAYVFHVKEFARYFGQAPDRLGAEQVHRYLLYLVHQKKASWAQYNQAVSALRFFYQVTCASPEISEGGLCPVGTADGSPAIHRWERGPIPKFSRVATTDLG